MNHWAKMALTWAAVIAMVAAVFAVRYARVQGLFTPVTALSPGACRSIADGLQGPGDFAIDTPHNAILISATNRQAGAQDRRDGIYFLKLNDPAAPPVKLAGTPANFHPGGISLFRGPDGSESLTVIDHKSNGQYVVESYGIISDGETIKLGQQSFIRSRLLISPHGIATVAPDHFYVTNDHATTGSPGRFAEDYLLWPHADVLLSASAGFRIAAQRIAFPSGILVHNGILYVAAANERRLIALSIEDFTGNLTEIGTLSLPAKPGNISAEVAGNLVVAGQSKPGASQVFRVRLDGKGVPVSYETLFSDDGHILKGASAAALWNGRLFISAADDDKMLDCGLK